MSEVALALLKILGSPGGDAMLQKLFIDHGITADKLHALIQGLPEPAPLREPR